MRTSRLEAFSDAVLAIIITVMVLGLKIPDTHDIGSFVHTTGHGLLTYALSFVYIAIYWTNHHRLFHLATRISVSALWANLALLFCLSLLPFTTQWMHESRLAHIPLFVYGANLLLCAFAYFVLQTLVIRQEGDDSPLKRAVGPEIRGRISPFLYLAGMVSTLVITPGGRLGVWIALACYAAVAVMWVVPDRRIDRIIREQERAE